MKELTESPDDDLARSLALLVRNCPELNTIVQAWPSLPDAVRAGILAMVKASSDDEGRV